MPQQCLLYISYSYFSQSKSNLFTFTCNLPFFYLFVCILVLIFPMYIDFFQYIAILY